MHVYLDNAATTKPISAAVAKANEINESCYGNPSSLHELGIEAELEIKKSAKKIAGICECSEDEVYFNSGGTEGDNTAVMGIAKAYERRGKHIITTVAEHPAVAQSVKALEDRGYDVTTVSVDVKGYVNLDELVSAVREDTILVSLHHVNSETGTIQDINTAAAAVKAKKPGVIFHSDGVQAFGKFDISLKDVDLYTVSAHKLHALKGTGALIVKKGIRVIPLMYGGGQQQGLRSGTENVAGIAAFALAVGEYSKNLTNNLKHVEGLKKKLAEIKEDVPGLYINGDENVGSPYILNMSFTGIRAEVLLHTLESEGIYVSTGSACNSKKQKNKMLTGYGIGQERVESAVRFSFSPYNTYSEIDYCIENLKKIIPALRR